MRKIHTFAWYYLAAAAEKATYTKAADVAAVTEATDTNATEEAVHSKAVDTEVADAEAAVKVATVEAERCNNRGGSIYKGSTVLCTRDDGDKGSI